MDFVYAVLITPTPRVLRGSGLHYHFSSHSIDFADLSEVASSEHRPDVTSGCIMETRCRRVTHCCFLPRGRGMYGAIYLGGLSPWT